MAADTQGHSKHVLCAYPANAAAVQPGMGCEYMLHRRVNMYMCSSIVGVHGADAYPPTPPHTHGRTPAVQVSQRFGLQFNSLNPEFSANQAECLSRPKKLRLKPRPSPRPSTSRLFMQSRSLRPTTIRACPSVQQDELQECLLERLPVRAK